MATQYAWKPVMKFVPTDGIEDVLIFSECFTDTSGPSSIDAAHVPDQTRKTDTNRKGNGRTWGVRPTCKFKFEIIDTATQAYLALIINRLIASEIWTTYLSLDGGLTYRQVELKNFGGPTAIEGKTFAGARYTLDVDGTELLDAIPNLGLGVW